jgi:hypothetical protein
MPGVGSGVSMVGLAESGFPSSPSTMSRLRSCFFRFRLARTRTTFPVCSVTRRTVMLCARAHVLPSVSGRKVSMKPTAAGRLRRKTHAAPKQPISTVGFRVFTGELLRAACS